MNKLPFEGLRVVEFTHMVMGPTCGMVLADLGAEVIKVEPPAGDNTRRLLGSALIGAAGDLTAIELKAQARVVDALAKKRAAESKAAIELADDVTDIKHHTVVAGQKAKKAVATGAVTHLGNLANPLSFLNPFAALDGKVKDAVAVKSVGHAIEVKAASPEKIKRAAEKAANSVAKADAKAHKAIAKATSEKLRDQASVAHKTAKAAAKEIKSAKKAAAAAVRAAYKDAKKAGKAFVSHKG